MKKYRYILHLLTATVILLSGCQKDTLTMDKGDAFVEGESVVINMSFREPVMNVKTRAALNPTEEEAIASIAVFIFDVNGYVVSQTIHEKAGDHSSNTIDKVLRPNGSDYIPIETLAGNDREIYVIANYHSNLIEGLRSIATIADMNKLIVTVLGNPMYREFGLCKVAYKGKHNLRKGATIPMSLKYLAAKITIEVVNKCSDLTIQGWAVDQLPLKSYILERNINSSDLTYHDAVNSNIDDDFYHDFADQNFEYEIKPNIDGAGSIADPKTYSSTFYMYENRRGGRVNKALPPGWTGTDTGNDYKLKAWYAPAKASIIKVLGQIKSPEHGTKSFTLNHYLGSNNIDNYDIKRGNHYIYKITINGLNSIDIDTNIEQYDVSLEVRPPADLASIDAHVNTRPFMLYTGTINDKDVRISAEVLEASGSTKHPDWLDITTISYLSQHIRKNSDAKISLWQQEGADNTYIRPKFIPNKATRDKLGAAYSAPTGVIIPSSEYPDDDKSLTYDLAHHRMCKQITNIPTAAQIPNLSSPIGIFLYIDEYQYSKTESYREAVVRFTFSKAGQSPQYTSYIIRQYPPYCFVSAPDNGDVILVERVEEYEHTTHAYAPIGLQMNAGMQWGKHDLPAANELKNGFNNTLLGVYQNIVGEYYKATNYLTPKYGSMSGDWSTANNGLIKEGADLVANTVGAPHSNQPETTNDNAHNIIYNTTAARYCHEKNQDINGDGNIDASETFWYLPAASEVQLFWTYRELIKLKSDYYWSSTQVDTDKVYAVSMLHESAAAHLVFNGTPMKTMKNFISTIGPPRVRCVRRATSGATAVQPLVSHRSNGTTVIDCSNLPSTMYTYNTKNNIAQGNPALIHEANRLLFKKFEVQTKENAKSDHSSLHFGNGKCDKTKGWRLPTQREMLLIYSVKEQLEAKSSFEKFDEESLYWTMSKDLNAHYLVNFKSGLSEYGKYFEPVNTFRYRCIREIN